MLSTVHDFRELDPDLSHSMTGERSGNGVEIVREKRRVSIESHLCRLVPEHSLHNLDVGSGADRQ